MTRAVRVGEVSFPGGGERLTGILMVPPGSGPRPAAVALHGSGPTSVRAWLTERWPFWRDIAAFLLEKGLVVLIFDKAGVGRSTGTWRTRSFEDRAQEALGAVRYLRSRPEVEGFPIGLIGHSQGGYVAQLAAARFPAEIAWVISLAGPAISVREQILDDLDARWHRRGDPGWLRGLRRGGMGVALRAYGSLSRVVSIGYLSRVIGYDPQSDLHRISQPVLALYAADDGLVRADKNARVLDASLRRSRSPLWVMRTVAGADHFFRPSEAPGSRAEQPWRWAPGFWEALGADEFWRAVGRGRC